MVKRTGGPAVDRPVRRLVDAINRSPFAVRTTGSCSAHLARAGFPYVRFEATDWEFVEFALRAITTLNGLTGGQTRLHLSAMSDEAVVQGSVRLNIYPWYRAGRVEWWPVIAEHQAPPRRLVRLWWAELDALAEIIERQDPAVATAAVGAILRARERPGG
jgi:hypothetical protein